MSRTLRLDKLIAGAIQARINCLQGNIIWRDRHTDLLRQIEKDLLPSGSGIDNGTTIDLDRSTADKIVLQTAYHHMNDGGMYDGWTEHTITVRPSMIHDRTITISGRDRNGIKDYLHETFDWDLSRMVEQTYDPETETTTLRHVLREAAVRSEEPRQVTEAEADNDGNDNVSGL